MLTSRDVIVALCKHCTKTCREKNIDIDVEKCLLLDGSRSRCWGLSIALGKDGIATVGTIDNRSILLSFYSVFNDSTMFDHSIKFDLRSYGSLNPKICLCHPQNATVTDYAYGVVLNALLKDGAHFTYIDKETKKAVEEQEKKLSVELKKTIADLYAAYKVDHKISREECRDKMNEVYNVDRFMRKQLPSYETDIVFCPAGKANAEELMIWCDMN